MINGITLLPLGGNEHGIDTIRLASKVKGIYPLSSFIVHVKGDGIVCEVNLIKLTESSVKGRMVRCGSFKEFIFLLGTSLFKHDNLIIAFEEGSKLVNSLIEFLYRSTRSNSLLSEDTMIPDLYRIISDVDNDKFTIEKYGNVLRCELNGKKVKILDFYEFVIMSHKSEIKIAYTIQEILDPCFKKKSVKIIGSVRNYNVKFGQIVIRNNRYRLFKENMKVIEAAEVPSDNTPVIDTPVNNSEGSGSEKLTINPSDSKETIVLKTIINENEINLCDFKDTVEALGSNNMIPIDLLNACKNVIGSTEPPKQTLYVEVNDDVLTATVKKALNNNELSWEELKSKVPDGFNLDDLHLKLQYNRTMPLAEFVAWKSILDIRPHTDSMFSTAKVPDVPAVNLDGVLDHYYSEGVDEHGMNEAVTIIRDNNVTLEALENLIPPTYFQRLMTKSKLNHTITNRITVHLKCKYMGVE